MGGGLTAQYLIATLAQARSLRLSRPQETRAGTIQYYRLSLLRLTKRYVAICLYVVLRTLLFRSNKYNRNIHGWLAEWRRDGLARPYSPGSNPGPSLHYISCRGKIGLRRSRHQTPSLRQ
jgi:hypothetical protein